MDALKKVEQLINLFINASDPEDKFFTSVMMLTAFTPSGVSDVLNLKADAISMDKTGSLWIQWNSKGCSKQEIIPIPFVPYVEKAFKTLRDLSEEARACAEFAEDNPGKFRRFKLAGVPADKPDNEKLTDQELIAVLQSERRRQELSQFKNVKWIKALADQTGDQITYDVLGRHAYETYTGKHWPYTDENGKLRASQALCVVRENEFHAEFPVRRYSWVMPSADMVNNKFKPKKGGGTSTTLWAKHSILDDDGSPMVLLTGELRAAYQHQKNGFNALLNKHYARIVD